MFYVPLYRVKSIFRSFCIVLMIPNSTLLANGIGNIYYFDYTFSWINQKCITVWKGTIALDISLYIGFRIIDKQILAASQYLFSFSDT